MGEPKIIELTHEQLVVMSRKTRGYGLKTFSFWINAHAVVYLTVFHIIYKIERDGRTIACRKADGTPIGEVQEFKDYD